MEKGKSEKPPGEALYPPLNDANGNKNRSHQLNTPISLSPWCEFFPLMVLFDEYGVLLRFSRAWGEMLFHFLCRPSACHPGPGAQRTLDKKPL